MSNPFKLSIAATALLLAVPVTASARGPSIPYQPPIKAQSAGHTHQVAKKHHGQHARRNGCQLTHDGLVCGGGSNHGGQMVRRGKGRGN